MTYFTPSNIVTGLRIVAAPFLYYAIVQHLWITAFLLCFFGSLSDFLDGYLARKMKQVSLFGERFDPFADKIMMTAVYIGLYQTQLIPTFLFYAVLGRDLFLILGSIYIMRYRKNTPLHPLMLSKINTGLQLLVCAWIVSIKALAFESVSFSMHITNIIIFTTFFTTLASGLQYARRLKHD